MNAFPTAPYRERIWSRTGPEFAKREGSLVTLNRALYGLPTAALSFHDFLADTLSRIGFIPSRADQELWIIKSDDHGGYDYLAAHVDDLIVAAKRPGEYIAKIEQEFGLRNIEDSPKISHRM